MKIIFLSRKGSMFRRCWQQSLWALVLTLLGAKAAHSAALSRPQIDLFILAGQSNMVGYGSRLTDLPANLQGPQQDVFWYDRNDRWTTLAAPTEPLPFSNAKFPGSPAIAAGRGFGPEISLGLGLQERLNKPVALVKYASNGANLTQDWQPGGLFYQPMVNRVNDSIAALSDLGYEVKVSGFFWLQGESDTRDLVWAQNYQANLQDFIGRVRSDFARFDLPVVLGLIPLTSSQLTERGYFPYADVVRSAQWEVAKALSNVVTVETVDLPRNRDNLHLNSRGLIVTGERMSAAWASVPETSPRWGFLLFGVTLWVLRRR